jgi:hypothetical protein
VHQWGSSCSYNFLAFARQAFNWEFDDCLDPINDLKLLPEETLIKFSTHAHEVGQCACDMPRIKRCDFIALSHRYVARSDRFEHS